MTLRPQYPWRKKGSEWQTECRLRAQRPSPPKEALRPAREQTAPLTVAPLLKNSHESDVERNVYDGLVSAQTQFFCGGGHFGLKAQSGSAQVFLCLPSSLGLNFYKGGKKRSKGRRKCGGDWGETTCQSSHMHRFQLMLTTYLYVAHSTILFRTPQKPSLLSP